MHTPLLAALPRLLAVLVGLSSACAVQIEHDETPGPNAPVPLLPDAKGDPDAGYRFMVNGNYIGCGIPVTVMERALAVTSWAPAGVVRSLFPLAASEVFTDPGIPGREGINTKLAVSFNGFVSKRGVTAINFNCMSCHAESIHGQTIVGLGNTTRDFTQDIRAATNLLPAFAATEAERRELARFREAVDAIAPYIQTKTIGSNPAINLTYALFARRSTERFAWQSRHTISPPSTSFPPVDVPPWWRMRHRDTMFYNGEFAQQHHRIMALASILCIDDVDDMRALENSFRDVEAYVKSVEPPPYPGVINAELAATGKPVFDARCGGCHGTHGDGGSYVEAIIPIDVIGTDPGLMEQQTGEASRRFREWGADVFQTVYAEDIYTAPKRGYVAPPLHGIWATAPFLHNGSVPSMEGVLDSRKRPQHWKRDFDADYDIRAMGLPYASVSYGQGWAQPGTKRYIYDTTLPNHENGGHTFGDALSQSERRAVMEYLKTL